MSTHKVLVYALPTIEPHPDPDTTKLGLVHIGGYQVVINKEQWQPGQLAAYCPPDSVVPTDREEFSFLHKPGSDAWHRIRVVRLRGVLSQGLLVPAPASALAGDDVMLELGIKAYQPPLPAMAGGLAESAPPGLYVPSYDLENWRDWPDIISDNEPVIITEKLHGANMRVVWYQDRWWVGSRNQWLKYNPNNMYWRAIQNATFSDRLGPLLRSRPGLIAYGEAYGWVQKLRYGAKPGEVHFAVFDFLDGTSWLKPSEMTQLQTQYGFVRVPVLMCGPFDRDTVLRLANGNTNVVNAQNIREGIVIEPMVSRTMLEFGRVKFKLVSDEYLLKDK
jgi:RNA ligase (TIGR02306 family)